MYGHQGRKFFPVPGVIIVHRMDYSPYNALPADESILHYGYPGLPGWSALSGHAEPPVGHGLPIVQCIWHFTELILLHNGMIKGDMAGLFFPIPSGIRYLAGWCPAKGSGKWGLTKTGFQPGGTNKISRPQGGLYSALLECPERRLILWNGKS